MKKILFSAAIVMSAVGIAVASTNSTSTKLPVDHKNYILKDTTPTDTTKPKDSTLLLK